MANPLEKLLRAGEGRIIRRLQQVVKAVGALEEEYTQLTDEELRAIQTEQDQEFADAERAAVRYARELTQDAEAGETRAALLEHFSDEQVVEITLVAAMANFTNRFNNGLGVMPED